MYRWLDHTSERELWIEDESPEAGALDGISQSASSSRLSSGSA